MEQKVLIIDDVHPALPDGLKEIGYHVDYLPEIKAAGVQNIISDYSGLIVRSKLAVDEAFLTKATNLKFIGRAGAGLDQLDVEAIDKRAIAVVNAPEGNRDALGEHLTGMLLTLLHNVERGNRQVRARQWDREGNRGVELGSLTVGLIGHGMMGSSFTKKLSSFGCQILAYDKYKSGFSNEFVKEASLDDLFGHADILSIHVPLTGETNGMVNGQFLDEFQKPIYFLNSARGKVAVLDDLIDRLKSGKVIGACLDVLENERFTTYSEKEQKTFDRLASFENVILTPHVAGWTFESYERISTVLLDKIRALNLFR